MHNGSICIYTKYIYIYIYDIYIYIQYICIYMISSNIFAF